MNFFHDNYGHSVVTIRVVADERVRIGRHFSFTPGIDDSDSECGLDHVTNWHTVIQNNGDFTCLENDIQTLIDLVKLRGIL